MTIDVVVNEIPAELRSKDRWVLWQPRRVPGRPKPVKRPIDPNTFGNAAVDNAETWASFDLARSEQLGAPAWSPQPFGLGYVLDHGEVGVDLDNAVDAVGIKPWARFIVDTVASYAELSPSGTGIHILARGSLADGIGSRRGDVEIYRGGSGRYFTFTGLRLNGTPPTLEQRQKEILKVHRRFIWRPKRKGSNASTLSSDQIVADDRELLVRAGQAKNGDRFRKLWNGDSSDYRPQRPDGTFEGPSRADAALARILAYWTGGDAGRVERLMRQSGLAREKWDTHPIYLRDTIAFAIKDA